MTFAEAGTLYLNRPRGLHPMDQWRLGELNEILGDFTLDSILNGWREFCFKRCTGLAPATVARFRATAQAAMNHAAAQLDFEVPRLPRITFKNERARYLSPDQHDRLIAAYAPHVRAVILVLAYQGCRTQEALRLTWPYVDLSRRTLHFPQTKTGKPRTVKMHGPVYEAIRGIWERRGCPSEGHVFLNIRGKPYADTREYAYPGGNPLRQAHRTACQRAGITDFRVHDWRHHWASWMVMSECDLPTLMRLGGWKSLRMVERYAAVSTEHMDEAITRMAAKFGQSQTWGQEYAEESMSYA